MFFTLIAHSLLLCIFTSASSKPEIFPNLIYTQTGVATLAFSPKKPSQDFTIAYLPSVWTTPGVALVSFNSLDYICSDGKVDLSLAVASISPTSLVVKVLTSTPERIVLLAVRYYIAQGKYAQTPIFMNCSTTLYPFQNISAHASYNHYLSTLPAKVNLTGGVQTFYALSGFNVSSKVNQFDLHLDIRQVAESDISIKLYSLSQEKTFVNSVSFVVLSFNRESANSPKYGRFSVIDLQTQEDSLEELSLKMQGMQDTNTMVGLSGISIQNQYMSFKTVVDLNSLKVYNIHKLTKERIMAFVTATYHCSDPLEQYLSLKDDICSNQCTRRTFFHQGSKSCLPCDYDCATCVAPGRCLTCDMAVDHRVLQNKRCVPEQGYFQSNSTAAAACLSNCRYCLDNSSCSQCMEGMIFSRSLLSCAIQPSSKKSITIQQQQQSNSLIFLIVILIAIFLIVGIARKKGHTNSSQNDGQGNRLNCVPI